MQGKLNVAVYTVCLITYIDLFTVLLQDVHSLYNSNSITLLLLAPFD